MKRFWVKQMVFLTVVLLLFALAGCSSGSKPEPKEQPKAGEETVKETPSKKVLIGEVFFGSLGDKSYNDYAFNGMKKAKEDLGVEFEYVETKVWSEIEAYMRDMARTKKYDLIIFAGNIGQDVLAKLSADFPEQKFLTITSLIDAPNVASYDFKMEESGFLLGLAAATASKSGAAGFIGGVEIPQMKKYGGGFGAGLKWVNKDAKLFTSYVGSWDDPIKAKEIANAQINNGADVIFHIAGASGLGAIEAVKDRQKMAIGFMNQTALAPENIIANYEARMDNVVFDVIKQVHEDSFKPGVFMLGLKEKGVDVLFNDGHPAITPDLKQEINDVRAKIVSGELQVPQSPDEIEAFLKKNGKL